MARMPIFGYTFSVFLSYVITQPFLGQLGWIFMGAQETIINRLVKRNSSNYVFWATFRGKIGVATVRAPLTHNSNC